MSDFNEENVALAVAVAREIGIPGKMIAQAIMNFKGVPGRMEFVRSGEYTAVIDYAHTPDSLEAAYRAVKPEPSPDYPRRASSAFWDRLARPVTSGRAATHGNVRKWGRSPPTIAIRFSWRTKILIMRIRIHILNEIEAGISPVPYPRPDVVKIPDRHEAIRQAVAEMKHGDVILDRQGKRRLDPCGGAQAGRQLPAREPSTRTARLLLTRPRSAWICT